MVYDMKNIAPVIKNEYYDMIIDDIGSAGEGIGKINGFTVFVEGALPGDKIRTKIVKVKKNYAFGKLISIEKKSEDRVEAECAYAGRCGGCQLQHMSYEAQLRYKTKKVRDCLERIGGLADIAVFQTIGMDKPLYYRNKAQFPVGEENGSIVCGFYAQRSHHIVNLDTCMIQQRINEDIIRVVKEYMEENHIAPYDEKEHKGLVRHILTRVAFATKEIMVCIIINGKSLPRQEKLVLKLTQIPHITSIVLNSNRERTNVILGSSTKTIWGKGYITDYIGETKFEISPLSFFQVNPVQTKVLYEKAVEAAGLSGKERVLDIYCGIGTISLFFARKAACIYGVEVIPEAIEDAKRNAVLNHIDNVEFRVGAAEEVIPRLWEEEGFHADIIVVDPPRKGCDEKVLHTIVSMMPEKVVYVSCEPSTLARDLKYLCQGGYEVKSVQPVDQFPMTVSVETVVLLSRK